MTEHGDKSSLTSLKLLSYKNRRKGTPSRVHCSEATYNSLMDANNYTASDCQYNVSNFSCEKRTGPQIDLSKKGLGVFQTYYINDYNEELVIEKQNSVTL